MNFSSSLEKDSSVQFSSVAQSCPTLCDPMNCSTPGLPVHHQLPEFTQTHVHRVMPFSHLIFCRPLLLPPIPPSIRVFSSESTLRIRWPKYWSFSFSIIPSKEHPGLIFFRMDWLDLLAVNIYVMDYVCLTTLKEYDFCLLNFFSILPIMHITVWFNGFAIKKKTVSFFLHLMERIHWVGRRFYFYLYFLRIRYTHF